MPDTMTTTLDDVLRESRAALREAELEDPALESRILVEHFTGTTRAHALTSPRRPIEPEVAEQIMAAVDRRARGEPVYRIIGCRQFYGLDLTVSPATLDPGRTRRHLSTRWLASCTRCLPAGVPAASSTSERVLARSLALVSQDPAAVATGVDVSADALVIATGNAERVGVATRFTPLLSDWFGAVSGRFDVIVSNPPYIPTGLIASLDPKCATSIR